MERKNRMSYQASNRLKSFTAHCKVNGMDLMRDDLRHIDNCLGFFDRGDFKTILDRYIREWQLGITESKNAQGGQGFGRRRANLWLLSHVNEKREKTHSGLVL